MWSHQWKTPMSAKWECCPLCWWYKGLGWNLKLWCQVMLSVPAIAITAFGAAVVTQEAEKTTVRSGKMFAQLHLWCAALAKLHLLHSCRSSVQRKHLNRCGPVFQRCLLLARTKWGGSGNDCLLTSFDWCRSLFYCSGYCFERCWAIVSLLHCLVHWVVLRGCKNSNPAKV